MRNRRNTLLALGSAATAITGWAWLGNTAAAEQAVSLPPPAYDPASGSARETAVFAGGCFWGVQAVFQHTQGVLNAVSGYSGGDRPSANYQSVSSGRRGHAEAVEVSFDPSRITYGKLLQIFFSVAHDPTQLDRQGPDAGPQYRSALFLQGTLQKQVAERYIAQLETARVFGRKVVTQLVPLQAFYPAEAYHQDYATRNPRAAYIVAFDAPKIANLKQHFAAVYRDAPVRVAPQRGA
jgi:peptide-methionine (S)-S-oxide reductase